MIYIFIFSSAGSRNWQKRSIVFVRSEHNKVNTFVSSVYLNTIKRNNLSQMNAQLILSQNWSCSVTVLEMT